MPGTLSISTLVSTHDGDVDIQNMITEYIKIGETWQCSSNDDGNDKDE